jgi:peptide chain release factor subunit 1
LLPTANRIFSKFLIKELGTSYNIKDRENRQSVTRILTKIQALLTTLNDSDFENGLFIYCGITEYKEFVLECVKPVIKCTIFYYNCGPVFITDILRPYMTICTGHVIFADGDQALIYTFNGSTFVKNKHICANLIKRQRKGGQSSIRFARLAEESRAHYVTHVFDYIKSAVKTGDNEEKNEQSAWIFGSDEIVSMILEYSQKNGIKLNNGGYVDFNNETINNHKKWLKYLTTDLKKIENENKILDTIVELIARDPDMLSFDPNEATDMRSVVYCKYDVEQSDVDNECNGDENNVVYLKVHHKNYGTLKDYDFIGLRYFANNEFSE